jgi:hypothetical protein
MIRLVPEDFEDPHELAKYAAIAGISLEEFESRFKEVVETDRAYTVDRTMLFAKDPEFSHYHDGEHGIPKDAAIETETVNGEADQ